MKPLIGLTGVYTPEDDFVKVRNLYMSCIFHAGGIPVMLPLTQTEWQLDALEKRLQGVVFTGGGDVSPHYFGEPLLCEAGRTEPERDAFELALYARFAKVGKPILGICRGSQLLAVANGEKLLQNVDGHDGISHDVAIKSGSRLCQIVKKTSLSVNSYHRQAIAPLSSGSSLAVCGMTADGGIEAIEHKILPFCFGVQWHPERLYFAESSGASALFSAFVSACG